MVRQYCCNPLKKKHTRKVQSLRSVQATIIARAKKYFQIQLHQQQFICTTCRIRLLQLSRKLELQSKQASPPPEATSSTSNLTSSSSSTTSKLINISPINQYEFSHKTSNLNSSLSTLGISPINNRKLRHEQYSVQKISHITEALSNQVFQIPPAKIGLSSQRQEFESWLQILKLGIQNLESNSDKIFILTTLLQVNKIFVRNLEYQEEWPNKLKILCGYVEIVRIRTTGKQEKVHQPKLKRL